MTVCTLCKDMCLRFSLQNFAKVCTLSSWLHAVIKGWVLGIFAYTRLRKWRNISRNWDFSTLEKFNRHLNFEASVYNQVFVHWRRSRVIDCSPSIILLLKSFHVFLILGYTFELLKLTEVYTVVTGLPFFKSGFLTLRLRGKRVRIVEAQIRFQLGRGGLVS